MVLSPPPQFSCVQVLIWLSLYTHAKSAPLDPAEPNELEDDCVFGVEKYDQKNQRTSNVTWGNMAFYGSLLYINFI